MTKHADKMPQIGFGTYLIPDNEAQEIVTAAIKTGYRHIDTAEGYGNESGIGSALKNAFSDLNLKRDNIFITSKLFPGNPQWGREPKNYNESIKACDNSLNRLGLDFLDCYLIHAPFCIDHRLEQWNALIDLKKAGKIKAIGVSNYSEKHIEEIINSELELPEVNQIELHPWCQKTNLVSFLNIKSIKIVAYSSLVPLESWREKPNQDSAKSAKMKKDGRDENSFFKELSKKYNVTEAQILLKWGLQKSFVILPKSSDPKRIKENFELNFDIDKSDMDMISGMERGDGVAWPGGDPCNAE